MIVSLEGLPGAGKSTTAKLLAEQHSITYLHERTGEHPFLDAFYRDIPRYTFETEIVFLLLHYHQYRDIDNRDTPVVLDYSPLKDLVFADYNLQGVDYELFAALYDRTSGSLEIPDLMIFLELDFDHTRQRIVQRARPYEQAIDPGYLRGIADAYEARFSELGQRVERVRVSPDDDRQAVADAVAAVIWPG